MMKKTFVTMANKIERTEMAQYIHNILKQYIKKELLHETMLTNTIKVNERFAANEQMIMASTIKFNERCAINEDKIAANTNKFNELLMNRDLSILNQIDEKAGRMFWKFTAVSMGTLVVGLGIGGSIGKIIWDEINKTNQMITINHKETKEDANKLNIKMNDLDKKIEILLMRSNK